MCLIAWNWQPQSNTPLLLIANRDEDYTRPASTLNWWPNEPILAGKDLKAGGTWLGISRQGRLAAITNYRNGNPAILKAHSRGNLVAEFLRTNASIDDFLEALTANAYLYNPFNLLLFDGNSFVVFESRNCNTKMIRPGIGALSNASLNSPWPKVQLIKKGLSKVLRNNSAAHDLGVMSLLQDKSIALDAHLPNTGISLDRERLLSPIFIQTPEYGTRASSIIRYSNSHVSFSERSFAHAGLLEERYFEF